MCYGKQLDYISIPFDEIFVLLQLDGLPAVVQQEIAQQALKLGKLCFPQLRCCSQKWRSICNAEITTSSLQACHLPTAVPFLNTLPILTHLAIRGSDETESTIGSKSLEGLKASLTVLTVNFPHNGVARKGNILKINSLGGLILPWCLSLQRLHLSDCQISGAVRLLRGPAFFLCFPQLLSLELIHVHTDPALESIDLTGLAVLQKLDCSRTAISFLILGDCKGLTSLQCSGNQLQSLNLSACQSLAVLDCKDNELVRALDLSNCMNILSLDCSRNKLLTAVILPACTKLETLISTGNQQLSTLDLSACASLKHLTCTQCQLSNISLSDSATLDLIACEYNSEHLVISGGLHIERLSCEVGTFLTLPIHTQHELVMLELPIRDIMQAVAGFEQLLVISCSISKSGSVDVTGCTAVYMKCRCTAETLQILGREVVYHLILTGTCHAEFTGFSMLTELTLTLNNHQEILDLSVCKKTLEKVTLSCAWGRRTVQTIILLDGCTSLTHLECQYLETLTHLKLQSCVGLVGLVCVGSNIESLDVSCCPLLRSLCVSHSSQLKNINTNNCNRLVYSTIQADDCPNLVASLSGEKSLYADQCWKETLIS